MIADTFFIEETKESSGDFLTRVGTDGLLWAAEFNATMTSLGYQEIDENLLNAWFCSAISVGWDDSTNRHRKAVESIQDMLDIQTSPGNYDVSEYMRGLANGLILAGSCLGIADADQLIDPSEEIVYEEAPTNEPPNVNQNFKFKPGDVVQSISFELGVDPTLYTVDTVDPLSGRITVLWFIGGTLWGGKDLGDFDPNYFVLVE